MSNFQTGLDQVVAQNIMFNERLNSVSSYASKAKSSVITSLQKNVVPMTDGKTTVPGPISQPIITKSNSRMSLIDNDDTNDTVGASNYSDEDGFLQPSHVIRKQRKEFNKAVKRQVISGCSKGQSVVKGAPEPSRDLFIYRVDTATALEDLKQYIVDHGFAVRSLEMMSKPDAQWKSFKLTVPRSQFDSLFDSNVWPEGICVRRFFNRRELST